MKLFEKDIDWHNQALSFVRQKRDKAAKSVAEWESLREIASYIKKHTLSYLDEYLLEFEKNATKNGIEIFWAVDDKEFNHIVFDILQKHSCKKVVKSKSMLTEECGLNPFLEKRGIEVVDTDLGERIVQLRKEKPSHIVLPAIHLTKEEVAKTFGEKNSDPAYLTNKARQSLREHFLSADAAITGVNFAIAKEGSFVVCTNEGNADLGTSLTDIHIACMGIEKIIPSLKELGVFIRLLARSATGQSITTYTSHFKRPKKGKKIYLIIVDNKRSEILAKENFYELLKCIRCGACMNTCPIYKRAGGHNYHYIIPGPIGANLAGAKDIAKYANLSFASTLCGSCYQVCPVKINLPQKLVLNRKKYVEQTKKSAIFMMSFYILHSLVFPKILKFTKFIPHRLYKNRFKNRIMPKLADKTFREIYDEQFKR